MTQPPPRRLNRVAGRLITGPIGHGVGGLLDWVQFTSKSVAVSLRRRVRRR
jgi:hypothetical protein